MSTNSLVQRVHACVYACRAPYTASHITRRASASKLLPPLTSSTYSCGTRYFDSKFHNVGALRQQHHFPFHPPRLVGAPVYPCHNPSVETVTLIRVSRHPRGEWIHWNNNTETPLRNSFRSCLRRKFSSKLKFPPEIISTMTFFLYALTCSIYSYLLSHLFRSNFFFVYD